MSNVPTYSVHVYSRTEYRTPCCLGRRLLAPTGHWQSCWPRHVLSEGFLLRLLPLPCPLQRPLGASVQCWEPVMSAEFRTLYVPSGRVECPVHMYMYISAHLRMLPHATCCACRCLHPTFIRGGGGIQKHGSSSCTASHNTEGTYRPWPAPVTCRPRPQDPAGHHHHFAQG